MSGHAVVRVVLVDDHPVVRDGLKALLSSVEDMDVVGEAGSGEDALGVVAATSPDVVIMDIEMPGIGGIEATRRLATQSTCAVLVLTMYGEDEFVFAALRAGARGYLVKGAQQEDVLRTIRAVSRGDAVLGHDVADRLLRAFTVQPTDKRPFPELTEREREVLALLADGRSNVVIGRMLSLTPKTVANHVSNILTKLHAVDRSEAVVRARRAGLGTN
ncbi:MAG: response regulator transcription factor [Actinomycetota bacterium]|nr:response regulator transcription factor [Actinomycetota bacterium]